VLRELVRVAVCNEADELVVHLAGPEAAPAIEAREVRVSAMPLLVRPALPGGLPVTQDEDALVTTTVVTLARRRTPPGASLTTREVQVLQLFAESNTTREVAALIGISSKTLANGLTTTYGKLGVTSRTQAVTEAIRRGLVRIPD
jgi:DNA-binding CsgD family transcriptional regulator